MGTDKQNGIKGKEKRVHGKTQEGFVTLWKGFKGGGD